MNIVKIPAPPLQSTRRMLRGLEISQWLQEECGLVRDKDFVWGFNTIDEEIHFTFFDNNNEMASYLLMKWG